MTLSTPGENYPQLHASAYVAESAQIIGDVRLAAKSSVWFQSVLRGDSDQIVIGEETNVAGSDEACQKLLSNSTTAPD